MASVRTAVVMAGGRGRRLGGVEKPLVEVNGVPMIRRVTHALSEAGLDVWVAVSPNTPRTRRWAVSRGLNVVDTPGEGYVPDMIEAVENTGASGGVIVCTADLPLLTTGVVRRVLEEYERAGLPALSVHVPLDMCTRVGVRPDTVFHRDGLALVPTGLNIVSAAGVREEQEEKVLVLHEPRLAVNVNRPADIETCEGIMQEDELID